MTAVGMTMMTTMTKKKTMTDPHPAAQSAGSEKSRPAASRLAQERTEREAAARRALFVASVAGLATSLGVIAVSVGSPQAAAEIRPPVVAERTVSRGVIAEFPIPAADGRGVETIIRFVVSGAETAAPDLRTRAS